MDKEYAVSNCNSVSDIRMMAKDNQCPKEALMDSVSPAKAINPFLYDTRLLLIKVKRLILNLT